jgi:hypothetical protein
MPGYQEVLTMSKKIILLNVLLVIGILLTACGASVSAQMPANNQSNGVSHISARLQATEEPAMPTIQIFPTDTGGSSQIPSNTLLVYVLVGAVILIALVAVLRKS